MASVRIAGDGNLREKPPVWTTISPCATALTASVMIIEGIRR